jgi:transcriptional regulatory protein LEU3
MALLSLADRAASLHTIQGLLILCVWPVPVNTMHRDLSVILSGAALRLALQIGLHVVGTGQDFARTRLESGDEVKAFRAKLWLHCLMISHRSELQIYDVDDSKLTTC